MDFTTRPGERAVRKNRELDVSLMKRWRRQREQLAPEARRLLVRHNLCSVASARGERVGTTHNGKSQG
jgi:hypothetical protein